MFRTIYLKIARLLLVSGIVIVVSTLASMGWDRHTVHALPEYTNRTNQPCATCHVNPGGGGPRTLRGLLWTAQGRPDEVPVIEDTLLAPGVTDPVELFDAACAGCHGSNGEGLSATSLTEYYLTESLIRMMIERGAPRSGMPSFNGQLTDEQVETLVSFVKALSDGDIVPPDSYPLPPLIESCDPASADTEAACDPSTAPSTYRGN